MTRSEPFDEVDVPGSPIVELAAFLPLSIKPCLTGQTQIIDRDGCTFVDRAYQLRGFPYREGFKDEWEHLAPQIVEGLNGFGEAIRAQKEALEALRGVSGAKLPAKERRALARALEILARVRRSDVGSCRQQARHSIGAGAVPGDQVR